MYYLLPTFIILVFLIGSGTGMYDHDQTAVIDLITVYSFIGRTTPHRCSTSSSYSNNNYYWQCGNNIYCIE